jgi:hypothetical protein
MSAPAASMQSDRSDFRTVTTNGAKVGALTAGLVVVFAIGSRLMGPGLVEDLFQSAVVLVGATLIAFLPGLWVGARQTEGVAGAAAVGLVGTVVFMLVDVALLRPVRLYSWTWDAIGGGSGWWYLPVWWMYGTFLPWLGALLVARSAVLGKATLFGVAAPVLGVGLALTAAARLLGCPMPLPFIAGAGFTAGLILFAVLAVSRKT